MANFDWEKAKRNEESTRVKGRERGLQKTLESYNAFRQTRDVSIVMYISKIRDLKGGLRELQDLIKAEGSKSKILSRTIALRTTLCNFIESNPKRTIKSTPADRGIRQSLSKILESEFKQVKIDNLDHPEMIADFITMSDIELQKILASCALLAQEEVEQYLYGEKETPPPQAKPEEIVDKSLNFSEAAAQILAKLLECVHNLNTNPSLVSSNEINQLELKYTELYTQFKDDLELHARFSYLAGTFTKCNMLIERAKELKKL